MCGNIKQQRRKWEETHCTKGCELNIGGLRGDKDRCKLMDIPQGSGISRWLVGGEVGGKVVGITSNQRRGIAAPHPLSFCTPCPQQSATHPPTHQPPLACAVSVKKRKKCATSAVPWDLLPPHIKAASFSLNVNIKSVDHKSQHSLHKLPLPQPLILPSDEGERGRGVTARGSDGGRERWRERWR